MTDVLIGIGLFLAIGVVAVVLLAARDAGRHRRQETWTPLPVLIERIRDDAAFMVQQLQHTAEFGPPKRAAAIVPILEYYCRLETLAAAPHPSAEQALRLADESGRYIREAGWMGVFVDRQARKLAELAKRLETA
jgi:hypothetical protein